MPGPSNTLLIEGSFAELSEELAQYLDLVSKSESGTGLYAELEPTLTEIREKESDESPDQEALQKQKDEVLKKLVGRASVLNSAPEKGLLTTLTTKVFH